MEQENNTEMVKNEEVKMYDENYVQSLKQESIERRLKLKEYEEKLAKFEQEKQELEQRKLEEEKRFKELYEDTKGKVDSLSPYKDKYLQKLTSDWQTEMEKLTDDEKELFEAGEQLTEEQLESNLNLFRKLSKAGKIGQPKQVFNQSVAQKQKTEIDSTDPLFWIEQANKKKK